ncbi:ComF family protein [Thalassotalea montiporae]
MITDTIEKLVAKATQLIHLFNYCELCEQPIYQQVALCDHCVSLIPRFQLDSLNGDLLNRPEIYGLYSKCAFDHLVAISPYQYPMSDWLKQFKYLGRWQYQRLCCRVLHFHLNELLKLSDFRPPDIVMPVPIHINRWQHRGFNQTLPLARTVAKVFKVQCNAGCLVRQTQTGSQAQASGQLRRKQLKNNFALVTDETSNETSNEVTDKRVKLEGMHVALVDDVVTTGATVSEISRLLKAANVAKVSVYCLALSL